MGKIIYITGGARSGKSSLAEKIALKEYETRTYLATAIPYDNEMENRIEKHLLQRGSDWLTIEGYRGIPKLLDGKVENQVVLLDCLTNMMSNLLLENNVDWDMVKPNEVDLMETEIMNEIEELLDYIKKSKSDFIIVSNELGMGLVPPYPLGRHFRDISGRVNQKMARESKEAYLVVSGLKLKLK
ncbi:MAG: bifunctional adenosylcobinamide kinase/adenosylcobinamide-phosphate guanylyltransferase [Psychrilyobacter sp.]|nr:bifunctional adenosylcobinamide kinase/adenosylcobinamide-phosphate guanylyltransferase [Psychrilyobacter sp.]